MATYPELFDLTNDSSLRNRMAVACLIAAEAIRIENANTTNHADRMIWANDSEI